MARDLLSTLRDRPDYRQIMPPFPFPDLSDNGLALPASREMFISPIGLEVASAQDAAFVADYAIHADADDSRLLYVHLTLSWPPSAPASARQSTHLTTAVRLP